MNDNRKSYSLGSLAVEIFFERINEWYDFVMVSVVALVNSFYCLQIESNNDFIQVCVLVSNIRIGL